jgi:transcriptional regulator with XRE-family HTH domain
MYSGDVQMRLADERKSMMVAFGRRLEDWVTERGWDAGELSRRSGLTPSELSQIRRGTREPRLMALLILSDVLEVSLVELVEGIPMPRGRRP